MTIRDVAREAQVSPATVSRVMNGYPLVAETTARRVNDVIAALHFVPSATARNLATRTTATIGAIMPNLAAPFYATIIEGMEQEVALARTHLAVYATSWGAAAERARLPIARRSSDGLIVSADAVDGTTIADIQAQHIPAILLHHSGDGTALPRVSLDNRAAIELAIAHLTDRGCARIGYIAGPVGNIDADERRAAIEPAMTAAGRGARKTPVVTSEFNVIDGRAAAYQLLAMDSSIDAIICANDDIAIGALQALAQHGRRVPTDVAVVGCDDMPSSAECLPPLTTIHTGVDDLGRTAVRLLRGLLGGVTPPALTVLPARLVVRAST